MEGKCVSPVEKVEVSAKLDRRRSISVFGHYHGELAHHKNEDNVKVGTECKWLLTVPNKEHPHVSLEVPQGFSDSHQKLLNSHTAD
jgi:hypothetical protein